MTTKRGLNWRAKEDEALCRAWVSISEDGSVGINQPSETFWQRVYRKYLEIHPDANKTCTPTALTSRFKTINQQCTLWGA